MNLQLFRRSVPCGNDFRIIPVNETVFGTKPEKVTAKIQIQNTKFFFDFGTPPRNRACTRRFLYDDFMDVIGKQYYTVICSRIPNISDQVFSGVINWRFPFGASCSELFLFVDDKHKG